MTGRLFLTTAELAAELGLTGPTGPARLRRRLPALLAQGFPHPMPLGNPRRWHAASVRAWLDAAARLAALGEAPRVRGNPANDAAFARAMVARAVTETHP